MSESASLNQVKNSLFKWFSVTYGKEEVYNGFTGGKGIFDVVSYVTILNQMNKSGSLFLRSINCVNESKFLSDLHW